MTSTETRGVVKSPYAKTERLAAYEICLFANGTCLCNDKQDRPCAAVEKTAKYVVSMVRRSAALSEEG